MRSSNASRDDQNVKSEVRHSTLLRVLSDTIDPVLLDVVIDDVLDDFESGAFEKLFPGPIINVDRGVNKIFMIVVLTRGCNAFDENMGKIFIEVLNALILNRKIEKKFDKVSFFLFN